MPKSLKKYWSRQSQTTCLIINITFGSYQTLHIYKTILSFLKCHSKLKYKTNPLGMQIKLKILVTSTN
jgi:hypothetical protein